MIGVREPLPGVLYPLQAALERYLREGILREEALIDGLVRAFDRHRDRVAIASVERSYTYGELDVASDCLAAALLDLGLQPLDRALFQIGNCPELVIALLGCLKAGVIPVCTIVAHRHAEIAAIGNHAAARAYFVQGDHKDDLAGFALAMCREIPSMRHVIVCRGDAPPGTSSLRQLLAAVPEGEARRRVRAIAHDPYQVAFFQLSGGTTGVPKIIPRFSNEYLYNFEAVAAALGYQPGDCLFTAGPLIHNAGTVLILGPALVSGCCVAVSMRTDADALLAVMRELRPGWVAVRGPILERLRQAAEAARVPLDGIRWMMSTNAARLAESTFGVPGLQYFGMTEGVIMVTPPASCEDTRWGTVGRPISPADEVRLLRPGTDEDVAFGEIGELAVRGPYTVRGYYNAPERNAASFTSDGFYRSGDLMSAHVMDCGVCYRFRGRIKDVVDRAGEKISCQEVEDVIRTHPDVVEVAIVPVPDAIYGERACAFIVQRAGSLALDVETIGRHLQARGLAKFKWPERVELLPEFPQTRVGKIDKEQLRERAHSTRSPESPAGAVRSRSGT